MSTETEATRRKCCATVGGEHHEPACEAAWRSSRDFSPKHPHGSLVEQVHRVMTTDQGVDAWVIAEEAVRFVRERIARDIEAATMPTPVVSPREFFAAIARSGGG